jgi:hypothetical protein
MKNGHRHLQALEWLGSVHANIFPLGTLAVYMTEGCCHNLAFGGCRGHCSQVEVCVCSSATLLD